MESNFEFKGRKFKLCKINAFKQFHIVRRVGPILADLMPALANASKIQNESASEKEKFDEIAKLATPVMEGLSKLSDADAELVLMGLLEAVEMQQVSGNWVRVVTGSLLNVQDLELPAMLQLAGRAFIYNLSGFFAELPR